MVAAGIVEVQAIVEAWRWDCNEIPPSMALNAPHAVTTEHGKGAAVTADQCRRLHIADDSA